MDSIPLYVFEIILKYLTITEARNLKITSKSLWSILSNISFINLTTQQNQILEKMLNYKKQYQYYYNNKHYVKAEIISTISSGTGTGKTLISLVYLSIMFKKGYKCCIVSQPTLIPNWQHEHKKFASKWNFPNILKYDTNDDIKKLALNGIIIISSRKFALFDKYKDVFDVFILDEITMKYKQIITKDYMLYGNTNDLNHPIGYIEARFTPHAIVFALNATETSKTTNIGNYGNDKELGYMSGIDINVENIKIDTNNELPCFDNLINRIMQLVNQYKGIRIIIIRIGGKGYLTMDKIKKLFSGYSIVFANSKNIDNIYKMTDGVICGSSNILARGHNLNPSMIICLCPKSIAKFDVEFQMMGRIVRPSTIQKNVPFYYINLYSDERYLFPDKINEIIYKFILEMGAHFKISYTYNKYQLINIVKYIHKNILTCDKRYDVQKDLSNMYNNRHSIYQLIDKLASTYDKLYVFKYVDVCDQIHIIINFKYMRIVPTDIRYYMEKEIYKIYCIEDVYRKYGFKIPCSNNMDRYEYKNILIRDFIRYLNN